jgi:hypothetical protein
MIGVGLTKGVAKTTYGASKAVVKTGVKATTTTMKGTKKVVTGTVRAVTGTEKPKAVETIEYDSRQIAERNQSNLYDRISSMVGGSNAGSDDGSADNDALKGAILASITGKNSSRDLSGARASGSSKAKRSSVLMPTTLTGVAPMGGTSWDV